MAQTIEYRINGVGRVFESAIEDGSPGRSLTQQMLVTNPLRLLIDKLTGDVRFRATDVRIQNEADGHPRVRYTDAHGAHKIVADYVVGCDGARGASRASICPTFATTRTSVCG